MENGDALVQGYSGFNSPDEEAYLYIGDNKNYIMAKYGYGVTIGTHTQDDLISLTMTGRVGIGTTEPNYSLDVRGTVGCNTTPYHSDIKWKYDIRPLENPLDKIKQLRGVSFKWRDEEFKDMNFPDGDHIGVIAQEVEEVVPEVVHTDDQGFKSVEYANLVPLLIESIKEQQRMIDQQNEANKTLLAENMALKEDVKKIKEALGL